MVTREPKARRRGGATFLCPVCGKPSRVARTRRDAEDLVVRERICPAKKCRHSFNTWEQPAPKR